MWSRSDAVRFGPISFDELPWDPMWFDVFRWGPMCSDQVHSGMQSEKAVGMLRPRSFKQQLLIAMLAAIFVSSGVVGVFTYQSSLRTLNGETEKQVKSQLQLNARSIADWRERIMAQINGLAGQPAFVNNGSLQERAAVLQGYLSRNSDFLRFSIMDLQGIGQIVLKDELGGTVDAGAREYFHAAKSGQTFISDPIVSNADQSIIMNVAAPVYNADGDVINVLTGTISRDQIAAIVQDITFAETGLAYLVDEQGMILAHPDSEKVLQENILDAFADQDLKSQWERLLQSEGPSITSLTMDGEKHLVGVQQVPGTSWKLVMEAHWDELNRSVDVMLNRTLVIIAVILAAGVVVAWLFGNMLSKDIVKVSRYMGYLAQGDLSEQISVRSRTEIGRLAQSYNEVVRSLPGNHRQHFEIRGERFGRGGANLRQFRANGRHKRRPGECGAGRQRTVPRAVHGRSIRGEERR